MTKEQTDMLYELIGLYRAKCLSTDANMPTATRDAIVEAFTSMRNFIVAMTNN